MDSEVVLAKDVHLTDGRSTVHVRQGRYSKLLVWGNGALLARVNSNAEPVLLSADQYEQFLSALRAKPPVLTSMPRVTAVLRFASMPRLPSMPSLAMPRLSSMSSLAGMPRLQFRPNLGSGRGTAVKVLSPVLALESFLIRLLSLGIEAACAGCDALPVSRWSLRDART